MNTDSGKTQGTFFKEDVEKLLARYSTLSVYETIGALEVVKLNLLERLGKIGPTPEPGENFDQCPNCKSRDIGWMPQVPTYFCRLCGHKFL